MMRGITKKQKKVMDELFEGTDEKQVLENNKVSRGLYKRWLKEKRWIEEFNGRIESLERQSRIIIATYKPIVAAKLVSLIDCEKEHTARQACENIINMHQQTGQKKQKSERAEEKRQTPITQEAASEILAVLARHKGTKSKKSGDRRRETGGI